MLSFSKDTFKVLHDVNALHRGNHAFMLLYCSEHEETVINRINFRLSRGHLYQ